MIKTQMSRDLVKIVMSFWVGYFGLSFLFWRNDRNKHMYRVVWRLVLFNILFLFPVLSAIALRLVKTSAVFRLQECVTQLLISVACFEVCFTLIHKLFHSRWLYRFHKTHHFMTDDTIAFGALYASPVDFVFANYLPGAVGFLIGDPAHIYTLMIWSFITSCYVTFSHGIDNYHTVHHRMFSVHFGTLGCIDRLMGWNKQRG